MEYHKTARGHIKKTREAIAADLLEFNRSILQGNTQRKSANDVGIPRSTIRHWKSRTSKIPLPEIVITFFESPEGVKFLHRLVTVLQFVMTQVGACGIRLVCLVLELSELYYFVANSYESVRQRGVEMEKEIALFAEHEQSRLSKDMRRQKISIAEDETFHPKPCLVAIEPVSNYILLEEYSDKRDAASWNAALDKAIKGLSVDIIQSTSDEAKGIVNHVEQHLSAHHSPDIFHVQQDITKATSAAMASKVRSAQKDLEALEKEYKSRETVNPEKSQAGRPSRLSQKTDQEISEAMDELKNKVALSEAQKAVIRDAKKGIGMAYHPYDLDTGHERTVERVQEELSQHFATIESNALAAGLRESSMQKILKAKKVCTHLIATLSFFWMMVREIIGSLSLSTELENIMFKQIIPAQYLLMAGKKVKIAEQKNIILAQGNAILSELIKNVVWKNIDEKDQNRLMNIAIECAQLFQRSSSCLEGRNGYLSLRHHGLRHISDRKLKVLTVIHNYFIKRPDGTTAAERFFRKRPKKLLDHLLDRLPYPSRPAQKRGNLVAAA
jgi:hypothetical protein